MAGPSESIFEMCRGTLYRATVCVDEVLGEMVGAVLGAVPTEVLGEGLRALDAEPPERFVFFEAPPLVDPGLHIEKLLSAAWCIDCSTWIERGRIYGLETGRALLASSYGAVDMGELSLFEIGAGGGPHEAIGPDEIRYARLHEVDIFVTPRVAARLQQHISTIEAMYVAGPVVRSICAAR